MQSAKCKIEGRFAPIVCGHGKPCPYGNSATIQAAHWRRYKHPLRKTVQLTRTDTAKTALEAAANVGVELQKGNHEKETITKVGERAA